MASCQFLERPYPPLSVTSSPWETKSIDATVRRLGQQTLSYERKSQVMIRHRLSYNNSNSSQECNKGHLASDRSSQNITASFHRFPLLPLELRLAIWGFSLPEPRIISLRAFYRPKAPRISLSSNSGNPPHLSTCSESRTVALKHYQLSFATLNIYANLAGGDILHLDESWEKSYTQVLGESGSLWMWNPEIVNDLRRVKTIALSPKTWMDYDEEMGRGMPYQKGGQMLRSHLRCFGALEEVLLVLPKSSATGWRWGWGADQYDERKKKDDDNVHFKDVICAGDAGNGNTELCCDHDMHIKGLRFRTAFMEGTLGGEETKIKVPEVRLIDLC